jgi:uncharacterized protein (DUF1499 family)
MLKKLVFILVFIGLAFTIRLYTLGKDSQKMTYVKSEMTGLKKCTSELNCYEGSIEVKTNPISKILDIVKASSSNKISESSENYIYFTNQSSLLGFVDDVEILYLKSGNSLQYRSASRVGKSDLGANKKRIDAMLEKFNN